MNQKLEKGQPFVLKNGFKGDVKSKMKELKVQYKRILEDYIENQTERNLYIGQNFIRQLIQKNISPEEVISIHKNATEEIVGDIDEPILHGFDFLIEMMVHFGLTLREHKHLLEQQEEMRMEMNVATKIQNMLLKTAVPKIPGLDIGMVSIPIRKMNGDYVHFFSDNNYVSVAVTDVVGKGVPAALCMSMVKYGLDTLEFSEATPTHVLTVLNRIIEKSVDDGMFVSMFYGRYDIQNQIFTYASAGHEPAMYFNSELDKFETLESKGLLLGVMPEVSYSQFELTLKDNDFIVMITDGVTEFRNQEDELTRKLVEELLYDMKELSAQKICEKLYKEVQKLQDFGLEDDFTVVIFKKGK